MPFIEGVPGPNVDSSLIVPNVILREEGKKEGRKEGRKETRHIE